MAHAEVMSGRRPDQHVRPALSLQRWKHLTFLHWRYPAPLLRPLVPAGLRLQLLDGDAWVGLTPFILSRLRAPALPPVPGWSTFAEVNLRTYVTDGERDGVLFLRVHCARRLVVGAFRVGLGLPYVYVPGSVRSTGGVTVYGTVGTRVVVDVGAPTDASALVASLTGRWSAFTRHLGVLWRVPIEHPPWPLHEARVVRLTTDMWRRADLPEPDGEPLVHYSPGVPVRVGAPRRARAAGAGSQMRAADGPRTVG